MEKMHLSNLMLSILEQAVEPLRCLHGAGYFTEEEWMQLDLIMNKKYKWTNGPNPELTMLTAQGYGPNKITPTIEEAIPPDVQSEAERTSPSPEVRSICTSVEPSTDEALTPAVSVDTPWELCPAMASPVPFKPITSQPREILRIPLSNGLGHSLIKPRGTDMSLPNFSLTNGSSQDIRNERTAEANLISSRIKSSLRHKSVSSWASEVLNGPIHKPELHTPFQASGLSAELIDQSNIGPSVTPTESTANSYSGDVNAFETNNAAEWDELPPITPPDQSKKLPKKDLSILIEEKFDKIANIIIQGHRDNPQLQTKQTTLPPRTENRNTQRTATTLRSTRRKEARENKESKERPTNPLPKTKTCWFWAESVGGCRYRPEECLNLHVRPEPGTLPNYPLKDGKPTWGSLADASPQDVPAGKKPRSCWFWATRGVCDKGNACEYVHGWVAGGVAARPAFVDKPNGPRYKASEEFDPPDPFSLEEESFDLDERDVGDKAPHQDFALDPGAIASRIHAPEWFPIPTS